MKDYVIFPVTQGELERLGIKADGVVSTVVTKSTIAYGIEEWEKLDKPSPAHSDWGSGFVKKLLDDRRHLRAVINVEIDRKKKLNGFQRLICYLVGITTYNKGDYNE